MSVLEELQKTIDELSEEQQYKLLETAHQMLRESSEQDNPEYQALLTELLMKRYEQAKAHPERNIPWDEAQRRIKEKYGWK